jgi:hypothetical protein
MEYIPHWEAGSPLAGQEIARFLLKPEGCFSISQKLGTVRYNELVNSRLHPHTMGDGGIFPKGGSHFSGGARKFAYKVTLKPFKIIFNVHPEIFKKEYNLRNFVLIFYIFPLFQH